MDGSLRSILDIHFQNEAFHFTFISNDSPDCRLKYFC